MAPVRVVVCHTVGVRVEVDLPCLMVLTLARDLTGMEGSLGEVLLTLIPTWSISDRGLTLSLRFPYLVRKPGT